MEKFMALDAGSLSTAEALLQGDGWVSVEDAASLMGISAKSLLTELLNNGSNVSAYANQWPCWRVENFSTMPREADGSILMNEVEQTGVRHAFFSGQVMPLESGAGIAELMANGKIVGEVFRTGKFGAVICDGLQTIQLSGVLAPKSVVEGLRSRLAKHAESAPSPVQVLPKNEASGSDSITVRHGNKKFSELLEIYLASRNVADAHLQRLRTEGTLFAQLMDDPKLSEIDVACVMQFGKLLEEMPEDVYQAGRKQNIKHAKDLIVLAQREGLARKSKIRVKNHVARVGQVFAFAQRSGMMHFNPAAEFKRGAIRHSMKRAQDYRDVFTNDELVTVFSAPWYQTGKGTDKHWRPHYYLLPLLGIFTGGRLNELAQLYLGDIRQTKSGVWFIDFNLDMPEKIDADNRVRSDKLDKSLKTANALRCVPIHPMLVQLGLPLYAESLREAGEERLFPELRYDKRKGYGKAAGAWFNDRFLGMRLGIARDGRKTFHSLRHTFVTALERQNLPERVQAQLAGHKRGATQSGTRYTKDRDADELAAFVNSVAYDFLPEIAPLDIEAALQALKTSSRLKLELRKARIAKATK
jgi:integrase